jgi:hypothetical protein
MTALAPLVSSAAPAPAAARGAWTRHLAAIRTYFGDAWFARRQVAVLGQVSEVDELASLGASILYVSGDADIDSGWPSGQVDLILHLGLLPRLDLSYLSLHYAAAAAGHLVVESAVCDSHDPDRVVVIESNAGVSTAPSSPEPRGPRPGVSTTLSSPESRAPSPGIYPSPARIERILAEHGMLYQRLADSRCNGPDRTYDWLAADTGLVAPGQHRLWFARRG